MNAIQPKPAMNSADEAKPYDLHLRTAAERQIDSAPLAGRGPAHPDEQLLHELQVHQVELEMQNETLRQKQVELEALRDRYVDLYDFAPVGYLTLTAHGMIDEVNFTACTLLGMERKNLLQRRFTALVIVEDQNRWMQHYLNVIESVGAGSVELTLQRGDGTVFPALLNIVRTKVGAGGTALRIALTDITERKQAESALFRYQNHLEQLVAERTRELQSMARQLLTTEARERRALAEELHDDLGQNLALAKLKLDALAEPREGQASADYLQDKKAIETLLSLASASVRSYSRQLSPLVLYQFGLAAALESLSEDLLRIWSLRVKLHLCDAVTMDETMAVTLFRIVRELLLNISKHARVSEATLIMALDADSGMLEITVADDGIGFDVEQELVAPSDSGYGLGSIRQRVEFIGGKMSIDSQAGHGTIVSLTLSPELLRQQ
jgi:PAS domain S-box-containing protein